LIQIRYYSRGEPPWYGDVRSEFWFSSRSCDHGVKIFQKFWVRGGGFRKIFEEVDDLARGRSSYMCQESITRNYVTPLLRSRQSTIPKPSRHMPSNSIYTSLQIHPSIHPTTSSKHLPPPPQSQPSPPYPASTTCRRLDCPPQPHRSSPQPLPGP